MSFDFSKVKSITIPEGNVKSIKDSNNVTLWKGGWEYTINIGDYVTSVRYKIDSGSWVTITSNTTIEVDGATLYIQALSYEQDTAQWNYTLYNGDISRTEADAGGSVTVYQTRALQQYTVNTSGSGYTSTGTGTYSYGASYTVTLTANSDYCFTSYDSGGSGSNGFTCDNVTRYRTITYTGTLTGNVTINATADPYYQYEVSDDDTHTQGSITFNANSQVINIDSSGFSNYFYFTYSIDVNLIFNSRLAESDYGEDDRVITGYSGEYTSAISLGSVWLGSGTGYDYIVCNKTISSNASTYMSANDSAYGQITNNSYCTFTITNSTTNKSYTSPGTGVGPYDLYCDNSSRGNNTIVINNKSSSYDYSGEGTFEFEDMGVATRTLSRTLKTYTVTLSSTYGHWENSSGATVTSITNVPYGASATKSGQTITVNGANYNFVINSATAQYNYTFSSITIPSSTVTSNITITGTATRSTRYYYLTFKNDSSNQVTVYFRVGSGSWISFAVSGGGNKSYSTIYNNSISVYFKYGDATSSTITRTMTSDQTVYGDCSYTAPSWSNTQNIKYQMKASINSNSIGYFVNSGSGGGDAEDVFNRPSNATHIRFVVDGTTYDVPLPSDLPSTFYDWSSDYYSTSSAGGKTFEFERQIIEDEEDSYIEAWVSVKGYSYTQVNLLGTSYYAHYNAGSYSVWWN